MQNLPLFSWNSSPSLWAKNPKMGHIWLVPTPRFERSHTIKFFMSHPILDIGCTFYRFSPKLWCQSLSLHHASCHLFQWFVLPLSNTILMWCVRDECCIWIPASAQYWINSNLTYSPQFSDLRTLSFLPDWFSTKALKTLKRPKTSDLCFRKWTQQYLEKSSMNVNEYLS